MKWYHFVPGAFVFGQILGILFFFLSSHWPFFYPLAASWLIFNWFYLVLALGYSLFHPSASWKIKILLPFGFLFFHLSYGIGNLLGLGFKNKNPNF
jgi:hypothetical protein